MPRISHSAAKEILERSCSDAGLGKPSASTPTLKPVNARCNERFYWEGVSDSMSSTTERSMAFLRAYIEIAADAPIYADGIRLDRGHMPLDKSVMHRLCRDGYVEFDDSQNPSIFRLTQSGKEELEK